MIRGTLCQKLSGSIRLTFEKKRCCKFEQMNKVLVIQGNIDLFFKTSETRELSDENVSGHSIYSDPGKMLWVFVYFGLCSYAIHQM
jgi:hypothetical protein